MILTVRMKNPIYYMRKAYALYVDVPEYNDYTGAVVPNPKWLNDDSFCLSFGDGEHEYRVLKKEDVICGWRHEEKSTA